MSLDENKAIVQRILKEFWIDGNVAVMDELLASDCINHELQPGAARQAGL